MNKQTISVQLIGQLKNVAALVSLSSLLFSCASNVHSTTAVSNQATKAQKGHSSMDEKTTAVYLIGQIKINNPEIFSEYQRKVGETFSHWGGQIIAVRMVNDVKELEGEHDFTALVLVKFPSLQNATDWYNSKEYSAIRPIRQKSAYSEMILVPTVAEGPDVNQHTAFLMGQIQINDAEKFSQYQKNVGSTFNNYQGQPVVVCPADKITKLEGDFDTSVFVMVEFPSSENGQKWYDSPEYKAIRNIRQQSTKSNMLLVQSGFSK